MKTTALFTLGALAIAFVSPARGNALIPQQQSLQTPSQRYANILKAEEPSYRKQVIPLMARLGCSARECHGSFQGRGGFQLSLFGSEWDADYTQLTTKKGDEDETHINPKDPAKSLIITKPTMQVKHKGKERYKKDSWQYNLILKWIEGGAKNDADKTGELQNLEITPNEMVFAKAGQTTQLRVLAHWKDGSVEDVTELTRFKSNDEAVATVSDNGLVSCTGKGDTHIVLSYDNGVVPIPAMLAVSEFAGARFPTSTTHTKVDELVQNKLRKMGIIPAEICTDAEFLRRVSLDLTGTLPTPDEIKKFIADKSSNKRSAKIDELLKGPAYAAWWATKFCDYTGNNVKQINLINGTNGRGYSEVARMWYDWIEKRLAENMPYDKLVENIVLATSRSSSDQSYKDYVVEMDSYFRNQHPAEFANHPTMPFYWQRRAVQSPDEKALAFSHTFLGVRLECAQCHKHPFDRWTKNDFKQFTVFFGAIVNGGKPTPKNSAEEITYASVAKELRDKMMAEMEAKEGPAKDKESADTATKKKDVTKDQRLKKMVDQEITRRMNTGEMVPWTEVWTNTLGGRVTGKNKGGNIDPNLQPRVLGGERATFAKGTDVRQPLMEWLRSKENPYFAKAIVNRVWASYFNRGIVDPPDDLNIANAPSNTELLVYLADEFVAHKYDLQWLHREILNSDAYQRSWKQNPTNKDDVRNFSHAVVRQLPAEVMLDAIDMAVSTDSKIVTFASDMDKRAIGPSGTSSYNPKQGKGGGNSDQYFLTLFGKPARVANCDCERTEDPTLLQTLFTRNDPNLLSRIEGQGGKNGGWIGELRSKKASTLNSDELIEQVFLRTVSRPPTSQELTQAQADVKAAKTPVDGVRDLLWAMINTREFKVNH